MRKNYMLKQTLMILFVILMTSTAYAQLKIVKVNPATDRVTIKNFGSAPDPIDISTYELCNFPDYSQLGSMTLISGNLNLAVGQSVTVVSNIALADADGELGLYVSGPFGNAANIRDYMQWGSAGHQREPVAVAAGLWTAGTFVNVTPPYNYNGDGSQNGAQFWDTSLSVDNLTQNAVFKISPNPVASQLSLTFQQNFASVEVEIYDLLGSKVSSLHYSDASTEYINVSDWSNGLYFVKVKTENGTQTKRFIKQ